jgi:hypothetical protein
MLIQTLFFLRFPEKIIQEKKTSKNCSIKCYPKKRLKKNCTENAQFLLYRCLKKRSNNVPHPLEGQDDRMSYCNFLALFGHARILMRFINQASKNTIGVKIDFDPKILISCFAQLKVFMTPNINKPK